MAGFKDDLLSLEPVLSLEQAQRCTQIHALASPVDRRFLATFVVDFSWGSSVLEGGSYSALDTQALIEYGQRNTDKPTADAVLVLNHKHAAEWLWNHRELTMDNVCAMHALLTNDHGIEDVADSDHFLPAHQRGRPREYEEINLGASAYLPPFRPGTGFVEQRLHHIIATANALYPV